MFVLDTNVVSELRKAGRADANVVAWASRIPAGSLYVSAITLLELELGILSLERRAAKQAAILRTWMHRQVLPAFEERVLPVDAAVAFKCARLHGPPDRRSERDALIAATAIVHGMSVATRNSGNFEGTGATIVNPWVA